MVQFDPLLAGYFSICLLLTAFFAGAGVVLLSISRPRVRTLLNEERSGAPALAELRNDPVRLQITVLTGTLLASFAASTFAMPLLLPVFGGPGSLLATAATVLLVLVLGLLVPILVAARYPDGFALLAAGPVLALSRVISPVRRVFDRLSRTNGTPDANGEPAVTEDEIREWIDVGKKVGTIEQDEQVLLYNVLDFGETTAREVMTPRMDVAMVEDTASAESTLTLFHETGFSRLPVYHERVDNLVGVLNIKDVLATVVTRTTDVPVTDLAYDPYFVPETKKIDDLLRELQVRKITMAIVMDEYGGFVGIVTIEDILEALVGDIMDEFDEDEPSVQPASEGVYLVDASVWVDDLNERVGAGLPTGAGYETVGGLVIDRLGHIPHPGETIVLQGSGVSLVVMQMRGKRIVRVKLILPLAEPRENG
ncbi:MAG: HlyC/CorC family transporter [Methanospirillum sp.]|nr:HlyC/CorC family transporter [Methanospirillum sp.]